MIALARRRLRDVEARAGEYSRRDAAVYFPDFGPPPAREMAPPPDFSELDAEDAAQQHGERPAPLLRRRALLMSGLIHGALLALLALPADTDEKRSAPPPLTGLTVTLIDRIPAASARADAAHEEVGANPEAAAGASRTAALADFEIPNEPGAAGVPVVSPEAASPPQLPSLAAAEEDSGPGMPNVAAPAMSRTDPRSVDEERWEGAIVARLEKKKRYPRAAMRSGASDTVMLRITIDRQGRLLLAEIARSKGVALLDREALALAERAAPYPAPPPSVLGDALPMVVPIEFVMNKSR